MIDKPEPEFQIEFLKKIQRLLTEGQFTASYKFALLMAIADICVERGPAGGESFEIKARELAEKFVVHYWSHAAPFAEGVPLAAASGRPAAIVTAIQRARLENPTLNSLISNEAAWSELVGTVEGTVKDQPLWKLQRVGRQVLDFLYPNVEQGNSIQLLPGIAYCFRAFYPLLKDLIEGHWLKFVRELKANKDLIGGRTDLYEFLFGPNRQSLMTIQPALREIQQDTCFYCRRSLTRNPEIDHFIPWSMYSYDLGHNFVLSCKSCNGDKSARLASFVHLERWVNRNVANGEILVQQNSESDLVFDLSTSFRVAEFAYGSAESTGALTWVGRRNVLEPLRPGWKELIDSAADPKRNQ